MDQGDGDLPHLCWEHNRDNCVEPGQVSLARTANHTDVGDALSVSTTTAMLVSSKSPPIANDEELMEKHVDAQWFCNWFPVQDLVGRI